MAGYKNTGGSGDKATIATAALAGLSEGARCRHMSTDDNHPAAVPPENQSVGRDVGGSPGCRTKKTSHSDEHGPADPS
jgi:hypothetical protein